MSIYEIDAKVKELRELRNMEAEVKSAITAIEDSLKAEMLAKNTDVLSGKDYTIIPRRVLLSKEDLIHVGFIQVGAPHYISFGTVLLFQPTL